MNCFLHGNGSSGAVLNFKVIAGAAQPLSARENDIWVSTGTGINGYVFSAVQPENPAAGAVWFEIGSASPVAFNALKKNALQVYPVSCKQYLAGEWGDTEAYIYQNGQWVRFSEIVTDIHLFNHGDTCDAVTGGWEGTVNDDGQLVLTRYSATYANGRTANTKGKIDLTSYSILWIKVDTYNHTGNCTVRTDSAGSTSVASVTINKGNTTFSIDISDINGLHYVWLNSDGKQTNGGSIGFTVSEIWLTK